MKCRSPRRILSLFASALALLSVACGDDDGSSVAAGGAAAGGASAAGGSGGMMTTASGGSGGAQEYVPSAQDIGFNALNPVPAGEQILFNVWAGPDAVKSMKPDGSDAITIFEVYRVWSMAASRAADRVAFSCGDPKQEEHYGLTFGDTIQHSWQYDIASQQVELLAYGNINDECHHYGPSDGTLYFCRRHDFTAQGGFSGYRLGKIDLPSGTESYLTDSDPQVYTLGAQAANDGQTLYYVEIAINGQSQTRRLVQQPLNGAATTLRDNAHRMTISPDGTRYLYADTNDESAIFTVPFSGGAPVLVSEQAGTTPVWSPDGNSIAYVMWNAVESCSDVMVVAADGSQASAPNMIRSCAVSGEQVTKLAWIDRP